MVDFTNLNTQRASVLAALQQLQASVDAQTHDEVTLDAAVADAQAARDVTLGYKGDVTALRDQAGDHADRAEAAWSDVASAIVYQDLAAIAASMAVTAVDVFVYDTSKDSDGGAWRKRCQHTSWYNETLNTATRGSRREFPAVAVIVAEATKVTIYDGDDPALPMWMVFNGGNTAISNPGNALFISASYPPNAVTMRDGVLACGGYYAHRINMISEHQTLWGPVAYTRPLNIANRNASAAWVSTGGAIPPIVSVNVNDVAMTVLPDAQIDPATGLPVPTIAVAAAGGVSVIKHDGSVVDVVGPAGYQVATAVDFIGTDLSFSMDSSGGGSRFHYRMSIPLSDLTVGTWGGYHQDASNYAPAGLPVPLGSASSGTTKRHKNFFRSTTGLSMLSEKPDDFSNGMIAYVTSTYNTGWMHGDIKGAFLASTDATTLVGSGELVTNGTFDTDTSGWTAITPETVISHSSGRIRVASTTAGAYGKAQFVIPTVIGQTYTISLEGYAGTGSPYVYVGSSAGASNYGAFAPSSGPKTFTALSTSTYITLFSGGAIGAFYCEYDNISVKLADADRSVNNKGLIVNGTITRTVDPGEELAWHTLSEDCSVTLGSDISTTGMVVWWEKVAGVPHFYAKNLAGGTSYVDGAPGTPPASVVFNGAVMTIKAGKPMRVVRPSGSIASADQIAKMYADERVAFSGPCTLYGNSNEVKALAYDPGTGICHVGTPDGRSDFRGLRRVSNTTTPVTTAIAASGGLILEQ